MDLNLDLDLALAAAVVGALAVFVGLGALMQQSGITRRRVMDRALRFEQQRLEKEAAEAGDDRGGLLREDSVASNPALSAALRRVAWTDKRAATLEQGDVPLKVSEYAAILLGLFVLFTVGVTAITLFVPGGIAAGLFAVLFVEFMISRRASKRIAEFNQQLPEALHMMSTSLQSGFGIMEAMRTVAREMDEPLAKEFQKILDETLAGGTFEKSVARLAERIDSMEMRIVTQALAVHREVGGNLGEILGQVAETMREREELRRHVKALTSQERSSSMIIAALPLLVVGMFMIMAPELIQSLWETTAGHIMIAVSLTLQVTGFLLMRRVMNIEV